MIRVEAGDICWRVETARRAAFLIDMQTYYAALLEAIGRARRSICILGWAFDPRTRLAPDGTEGADEPDEIGQILLRLTRDKPGLDVRILIWRAPFSIGGSHVGLRHRAHAYFRGSAVKFREDGHVPFGACLHQKVVVIDDDLAFCGGGDIAVNRWDSQRHVHGDRRRILPDRAPHAPRHEVMMAVEGPVASALGALFRDRWGDGVEAARGGDGGHCWPLVQEAHLSDAAIGVARTEPGFAGRPAVQEIRRLRLACIQGARSTIFLESQYFTSHAVSEALARRLAEPDGPEVVLVLNARSPSWFDHMTMDHARVPVIDRLRSADRMGRLRIYVPRTSAGEAIVVHSKVSVFDDEIACVGSANLNNRSEGFDTECELVLQARNDQQHREVAQFRDVLLAHYLGVEEGEFVAARLRSSSLIAGIERTNRERRLVELQTGPPDWWDIFASRRRLGDPADARENWRLLKTTSGRGLPVRS